MKVIATALFTLLSTSTVTASAKSGKTAAKAGKSGGACNEEAIAGLWQYLSQENGKPWNAYVGCTDSGVSSTRCQITDQFQWKDDSYVTIAFFTPEHIGINKEGYCSFGYNDEGVVFFEETGPCALGYPYYVKKGDYGVKVQLVGPYLELLSTDDRGKTFYNEENVRLALNSAA